MKDPERTPTGTWKTNPVLKEARNDKTNPPLKFGNRDLSKKELQPANSRKTTAEKGCRKKKNAIKDL